MTKIYGRKSPQVVARKIARTKLYSALYGPCTKGAPHQNQPWLDANRRGHSTPTKNEFEQLIAAAKLCPLHFARVSARFAHLVAEGK